MSGETVACVEHGDSRATFVCKHILESLQDGVPRGFWWLRDELDGEHTSFCTECNEMSDEAWAEVGDSLCTLLCLGCFNKAAALNNVKLPDDL